MGGTMTWHVAPCLDVLLAEINAWAPARAKGADGSIGDQAHQGEGAPTYDSVGHHTGGSEHNPDARAVVCARDFTHDPAHADMGVVFDWLCDYARSGWLPMLDYLELENVRGGRKIEASRTTGFAAHDVDVSHAGPHLHVSTLHTAAADNDLRTWGIGTGHTDEMGDDVNEQDIRKFVREEVQKVFNEFFTWTEADGTAPAKAGESRYPSGRYMLREATADIINRLP